jgi:hypothetical protein
MRTTLLAPAVAWGANSIGVMIRLGFPTLVSTGLRRCLD